MIKPLLVVDEAQQWLMVGHLCQQAQDGQSDEEPVRRFAGNEAKCRPQRVTLRRRKQLTTIQQRPAQLVQCGERQLHLGLHARGTHDAEVGRPLGQVVEQHGFSNPGLAVYHQRATFAGANYVEEPIERRTFGSSTNELHRPADSATCVGIFGGARPTQR